MRVGLFDSGLGGLVVLKELHKVRPNNEYIYYGDTLNLPYGDKSKEELLKLSKNIINFLEEQKVETILIACGTVSSNIYPELKEITEIPIYNVIDSTIEYIKKKNYQNILVMATNATVNSHIFKTKLNNIQVQELACPKIVPLIENNENDELKQVVKEYLKPFQKQSIDAIVLGCTHYALIEDIIKETINTDILNMGVILANTIKIKDTNEKIELFFSRETENLKQNIDKILGKERC